LSEPEEKQGCFKRLLKRNKVSSTEPEIEIGGNEMDIQLRKQRKEEERADFEAKIEKFKFYLAGNFFEDNIGTVEVETEEKDLIRTSFQMPAFTQCLTQRTRDLIPFSINKVS